MSAPHSLRWVVIAPDQAESDTDNEAALALVKRSRQLRIGPLEDGFKRIASLPADTFLAEQLAQLQPDMRTRKAMPATVWSTSSWPPGKRAGLSCCWTNDEDASHVKEAVAAGVWAEIIAGLYPMRVRPTLDMAMARFEHEQSLRRELASARIELRERKVIDRATGLLMQGANLVQDPAAR